ncbi:MAG: hypothetical protein M3R15_28630 [Acidobacteriota bacterium]|nr:hypothetical protein [Acidobacteriota bacterium]
MGDKHKLEFTDDEFETLYILVNDGIKKLDAMSRVDLMEPSRKRWLKIMESIKRKLLAEAPPKGFQLEGFQLGRRAQSGRRSKQAN